MYSIKVDKKLLSQHVYLLSPPSGQGTTSNFLSHFNRDGDIKHNAPGLRVDLQAEIFLALQED